jgi:hypothetical protein
MSIFEILKHPWVMFYDFDRHRRTQPEIYGRYKPGLMKRIQCWILSERIEPIDWEEVPTYKSEYDVPGVFIQPRDGVYHPYECVSQPNMVSEDQQLIRYVISFGLLYGLHRYTKLRPEWIAKIPFFGDYYRNNNGTRLWLYTWLSYVILRSYTNRHYYRPYN